MYRVIPRMGGPKLTLIRRRLYKRIFKDIMVNFDFKSILRNFLFMYEDRFSYFDFFMAGAITQSFYQLSKYATLHRTILCIYRRTTAVL